MRIRSMNILGNQQHGLPIFNMMPYIAVRCRFQAHRPVVKYFVMSHQSIQPLRLHSCFSVGRKIGESVLVVGNCASLLIIVCFAAVGVLRSSGVIDIWILFRRCSVLSCLVDPNSVIINHLTRFFRLGSLSRFGRGGGLSDLCRLPALGSVFKELASLSGLFTLPDFRSLGNLCCFTPLTK